MLLNRGTNLLRVPVSICRQRGSVAVLVVVSLAVPQAARADALVASNIAETPSAAYYQIPLTAALSGARQEAIPAPAGRNYGLFAVPPQDPEPRAPAPAAKPRSRAGRRIAGALMLAAGGALIWGGVDKMENRSIRYDARTGQGELPYRTYWVSGVIITWGSCLAGGGLALLLIRK